MDSTKRFSNRVENYIKYRPSYPLQLIDFFQHELGLTTETVIADIGSGTGILTELFLKRGHTVIGVEPNKEMRLAAEKLLGHFPQFTSVDGKAEKTGLPSNSCNFVTAGQAFHWFDLQLARVEFQRILNNQGLVALIWNERDQSSPFLEDYENYLLEYSVDYAKVDHRNIDETTLEAFFAPNKHSLKSFANYQLLDGPALQGRYLSCSYAYTKTHPDFVQAIAALQDLFEKHQHNGKVKIDYTTKLYFGRLL